MRNRTAVIAGLIALFCVASPTAHAISWSPGWSVPLAAEGREVSEAERTQARRLADAVDSPDSARKAIRAWEAIATAQPDEPDAWIELACLQLLEGAAYRNRAKEQLKCYIAALQSCERAMATNPEFLRRVQGGQTVWEAVDALGPREMGAMNFWATGVFYIFRDCLGLIGRIVNVGWMDRAKAMLQRMDAVDPAWEEYTSTFSWGIYYLALPEVRGGDKTRARECFERAVTLGEHRTLPRWGRGKYFYSETGETAAARADLEAVAAQSLEDLGGSPPWNRYFKADAARLLAKHPANRSHPPQR
jgi:tetratricopeptide (TPR) repeat protein